MVDGSYVAFFVKAARCISLDPTMTPTFIFTLNKYRFSGEIDGSVFIKATVFKPDDGIAYLFNLNKFEENSSLAIVLVSDIVIDVQSPTVFSRVTKTLLLKWQSIYVLT